MGRWVEHPTSSSDIYSHNRTSDPDALDMAWTQPSIQSSPSSNLDSVRGQVPLCRMSVEQRRSDYLYVPFRVPRFLWSYLVQLRTSIVISGSIADLLTQIGLQRRIARVSSFNSPDRSLLQFWARWHWQPFCFDHSIERYWSSVSHCCEHYIHQWFQLLVRIMVGSAEDPPKSILSHWNVDNSHGCSLQESRCIFCPRC